MLLLSDPALNQFSKKETPPSHLFRFVKFMLTIAFDQKNILLPTIILRNRRQRRKEEKAIKINVKNKKQEFFARVRESILKAFLFF